MYKAGILDKIKILCGRGGKSCMLYEDYNFVCFGFNLLGWFRSLFYKIKFYLCLGVAGCKKFKNFLQAKVQTLNFYKEFYSVFNNANRFVCRDVTSNNFAFVLLEKGSLLGVVNFNK